MMSTGRFGLEFPFLITMQWYPKVRNYYVKGRDIIEKYYLLSIYNLCKNQQLTVHSVVDNENTQLANKSSDYGSIWPSLATFCLGLGTFWPRQGIFWRLATV